MQFDFQLEDSKILNKEPWKKKKKLGVWLK